MGNCATFSPLHQPVLIQINVFAGRMEYDESIGTIRLVGR